MLPLLLPVTLVTAQPAVRALDDATTSRTTAEPVIDADQFRAVCHRLQQATVRIEPSGDRASGVLISRCGLIVTVAHAVPENMVAGQMLVPVRLINHPTMGASVLAIDAKLDLALLQLNLSSDEALPANAEPLNFEDDLARAAYIATASGMTPPVVACGFPGRELEFLNPPVRLGHIVFSDEHTLRSTCQLTVGDSGGPLISVRGKLLGINRRIGLGIDNNHHIPLAHVLAFLQAQVDLPSFEQSQALRKILKPLSSESPAADHNSKMDAAHNAVISIPDAAKSAFRNYSVRIELPEHSGQPKDPLDVETASARGLQWKHVAQGTIVGPHTIATKLSLLQGATTCRCKTFDDTWLDAVLTARFVEQDLAILHTQTSLQVQAAIKPRRTRIDQRSPDDAKTTEVLPLQSCTLAVTRSVSGHLRPGIISRVAHIEPPAMGRLGVSVSLRPDNDGANLVIDDVSPNTTAAIAGVQQDDRLLTCNGQSVSTIDQLSEVLSNVQPGDWIQLTVLRHGQKLQLSGILTPDPSRMFARDEFLDGRSGPLSNRRNGFASVLQHDIPVLPADCGGPVIDFEGRLAAINIARRGRESTLALSLEAILQLIAEESEKRQPPEQD